MAAPAQPHVLLSAKPYFFQQTHTSFTKTSFSKLSLSKTVLLSAKLYFFQQNI
jgi:hypothetical protein